jgi:23S rRNA (pseudouridine1915-N3)-methyltransferase
MQSRLIQIGKDHPAFIAEAAANYGKRLSHYLKFEILTLPPGKSKEPQLCKQQEAQAVLKKLDPADRLVLLDEDGKAFNSRKFPAWLEDQINYDTRCLNFVIGGAWGFDESLYERSELKMRLSDFTFSHQLARVVFLEQIYRACTIIRNEPYHNGEMEEFSLT